MSTYDYIQVRRKHKQAKVRPMLDEASHITIAVVSGAPPDHSVLVDSFNRDLSYSLQSSVTRVQDMRT
jgi:hypothetical protein